MVKKYVLFLHFWVLLSLQRVHIVLILNHIGLGYHLQLRKYCKFLINLSRFDYFNNNQYFQRINIQIEQTVSHQGIGFVIRVNINI